MASDSWNSAKVILGVITGVAFSTYTVVHYVEVRPADRALRAAEDKVSDAEAQAVQLRGQLSEAIKKAEDAESRAADAETKLRQCGERSAKQDVSAQPETQGIDKSQSNAGTRPLEPKAADSSAHLRECEGTVERLGQQVRKADESNEELQALLDDCWARCKLVTPRNFTLDKGRRQTVEFRGVVFGFTFVDWTDRDSKDVTIMVDRPNEAPVSVRGRQDRASPFSLGAERFMLEIRNPERINDRVCVRVEQVD